MRIESRITSVVNGRIDFIGLHPDNGEPTFLLKLNTDSTVKIEIINIEFFLFGIHRCMNADLVMHKIYMNAFRHSCIVHDQIGVHTSMNTKQK